MKIFQNALQIIILLVSITFMTTNSFAQKSWDIQEDGCGGVKWSKGLYGNYNEEHFDLVTKELSLTELPKELFVNGSRNGGVRIKGWDKNEISIKACIQARGRSVNEAKKITSTVAIETKDGKIRAVSPYSTAEDVPFGVNYDIKIPQNMNINLVTLNGGINISNVKGTISFNVDNGGAVLNKLAGDVRGQINNGGLTIELDGDRWEGIGIDTKVGNGNILFMIPPNYSARIETGTRWGRLDSVISDIKQGVKENNFTINLGNGGSTLKALTDSGNVEIRQ